MNLEELRAVQADERDSDSLQPLPDSFYQDAAEYLNGLREERKRAAERAADPFSSEEVRRLTDEIETAEEVLEAIYNRRVGKVLARASLAAADMTPDEEGLTDEEAILFSDLVERIETNREAVLAAIAGEGSLPDPSESSSGSGSGSGSGDADGRSAGSADAAGSDRPAEEAAEVTEPEFDPASETGETTVDADGFDVGAAMGGAAGNDLPRGDATDPATSETEGRPETDGGPAVAEPGARTEADPGTGADGDEGATGRDVEADGTEPDRITVRITRDVGEVFGVDERVYDLAAEDVVTLPTPNAEPLIERDAAQPLE